MGARLNRRAIVQFVGGTPQMAIDATREMYEITSGEAFVPLYCVSVGLKALRRDLARVKTVLRQKTAPAGRS